MFYKVGGEKGSGEFEGGEGQRSEGQKSKVEIRDGATKQNMLMLGKEYRIELGTCSVGKIFSRGF